MQMAHKSNLRCMVSFLLSLLGKCAHTNDLCDRSFPSGEQSGAGPISIKVVRPFIFPDKRQAHSKQLQPQDQAIECVRQENQQNPDKLLATVKTSTTYLLS